MSMSRHSRQSRLVPRTRTVLILGVALALSLAGLLNSLRFVISEAAAMQDGHTSRAAESQPAPPSLAQLQQSIALASQQLLDVQLKSGLFDYDFDFLLARPSGKANIVRQAGTTYALGEAYADSRDPTLRQALARAIAALAEQSIAVQGGELISFNGKRSGIKSGATALALLAELYYFRASGDGRFGTQRDRWLNGLLALHRPGAGFLRAPDSQEESHYYNGEIWLALAFYNMTFEAPALAERLKAVDTYMMAAYGKAPHIGFFHWGAMAAERRFADSGDPRFRHFAQSQARNYLEELRPKRSANSNTCYSLEGLIPALELTPSNDPLYEALTDRIAWEMRKNLTLQIQPAQKALELGDDTRLESPHLVRYPGAFLAGRKKLFTRIDYTQHCLSAAVKYRSWMERGS